MQQNTTKQEIKKANIFVRSWNKFKTRTSKWSAYKKNKWVNSLWYLLFIFVGLGMNYVYIFKAFVPNFFILDLALMILSFAPILFFKNTIFDCIYLPIIMGIAYILGSINANYGQFMGTIFTIQDIIQSITQVRQAAMRIQQLNWLNIGLNIGLWAIFLSGLLVFNIKFKFVYHQGMKKDPTRLRKNIFAGIFLGASLWTYEFTMAIWVLREVSHSVDSIKYVNYASPYHVKNIGIINFYNREIRQLLFDKKLNDDQIISYLSNQKLVKDSYTGFLNSSEIQNPNIFCIMIETGDRWMYDQFLKPEEAVPNLYKYFKTEGIYGEHNYSMNHTNISDTIGLTGNYPSNSMAQGRKFYLPFALPNILNKKNYSTRLYYDMSTNNDGYGDMNYLPQMGFTDVFFHDKLLPELKPWIYDQFNFSADSTVAQHIVQNLKDWRQKQATDKPFYSYWMTMFMHMDTVVTNGNKQIINKLYDTYYAKLKDLENRSLWINPGIGPESKNKFEIWAMKIMDFDNALGQLATYFYDSNDSYLNNTLLIAFGDHIQYEMGDKVWMCKQTKNKDANDVRLYSSMLGMYHPSLTDKIDKDESGLFTGHNLNRFTSPNCIVPTIQDLLGIPYNKKFYQGQSIFDLQDQSVYNKSMDDIFYSAWIKLYMNEHYTSNNGVDISFVSDDNGTREEFINKVHEAQQKLRILDSIYHKDFFSRHDYDEIIPKE